MGGQQTMSGQNSDLTGQNVPLSVMLTSHGLVQIYLNSFFSLL